MSTIIRSVGCFLGYAACLAGCQGGMSLSVKGVPSPQGTSGAQAGIGSSAPAKSSPASPPSDADTARLVLKEVFGDVATQKAAFLQNGGQGSPPADIAAVEAPEWFGRQKDFFARYQVAIADESAYGSSQCDANVLSSSLGFELSFSSTSQPVSGSRSSEAAL